MIILGIDPGSRVTGYGVVDATTNQLRRLGGGCIRTSGDDISPKLKEIYDGISEVIREYRPQVVAVEKVFVSINVKSALLLGHARGAAICACAADNLNIYEYSPRGIKKTITASGSATKDQVHFMVRAILNLKINVSQDESDALACAITHYQHIPMLQSIDGLPAETRYRELMHNEQYRAAS